VINDMTLESGVAWTLPIVLDVDVDTAGGVVPGDRVGLITAGETPVVLTLLKSRRFSMHLSVIGMEILRDLTLSIALYLPHTKSL
jgi:hypothetical protein